MNAASRFEMNFVFLQNYLTKAVAIADAELMGRLASCAIRQNKLMHANQLGGCAASALRHCSKEKGRRTTATGFWNTTEHLLTTTKDGYS